MVTRNDITILCPALYFYKKLFYWFSLHTLQELPVVSLVLHQFSQTAEAASHHFLLSSTRRCRQHRKVTMIPRSSLFHYCSY
jgi:hypothetical protein